MKKIKVTEKNGASVEYVNDGEIIDRLHLMGHGLPERVIEAIDGTYDPADVIEIYPDEVIKEPVIAYEMKPDEAGNMVEVPFELEPGVYRKTVKLKAEYTVEIEDISYEHDLSKCIANRKSEYPGIEEWLNAYFDGGEPAVQELQAKRVMIKQKYPKPVKE